MPQPNDRSGGEPSSRARGTRETEAERLVLEWLEARERGVAADPEELIRRHPELAEALRERLQAIELVDAALGVPDAARPPQRVGQPRMESAVTGLRRDDPAPGEVVVPSGTQEAPPASIGEFRIVREIGRGGMGVVYEAEQLSMRRFVALKVLFPAVTSSRKAVLRFEREARAAGRLHHTNLVPVHGMGEERGVWWYAMELVQGRPLDAVIEDVRRIRGEPRARGQGTPISSGFGPDPGSRAHYERVADAFAGVAEGLEFAHQAGVVHRDVKPSNLILDADGRLRLTDFGLARIEDEGAAMTLSGEVVGTPAYMSPEQVRTPADGIDARTDVYSLGATLYEVLTLRAPFHDAAPVEVFSKIVSADPVPLRRIDGRIPRDLAAIVEKSMEKDRQRRYATAGEMAHDLRLYAEGAAIRAKRIGPLGRAWRLAKRHKALTSLAAAVVVLAALGSVAAFHALGARAARIEFEYAALCMQAEEELAQGMEVADVASIRIAEEQTRRANALLDRAIELDPERPEAYFGRAVAGAPPYDARLADLDAAHLHGLGAATYHMARAFVLRISGRTDDSQTEERIAAGLPQAATPEDLYFRGWLLIRRGERREAIVALTEALGAARSEGFGRHMALLSRALAREIEGDFPGAIQDLAALDQSGAARIAVRVRLASLWRRAGQPGTAESAFDDLLAETRRRGTLEAFRELSGACEGCREIAWTERACAATAETHGNDCDVLIAWSEALAAVKRPRDGLEQARQAVSLDPVNARAHAQCGWRLLDLELPKEALEAFDAALAISPAMIQACRGSAEAHVRLRERDKAVEVWRNTVGAANTDPFAHFAFGKFLCNRLGEHAAAEEPFRTAISLTSDEVHAWEIQFELARALAGSGQRDKAIAAFREAEKGLRAIIARQPDKAARYYSLGLTHFFLLEQGKDSKDADAAAAAFRKAIQLNPRHVESRVELGLLIRFSDPDGAIATFNKALELDPAHQNARMDLAYTLDDNKHDHAAAAKEYRELIRLTRADPTWAVPSADAFVKDLAYSLTRLGDWEGAEAAIREALAINQDSAICTYNSGWLKFFQNQYEAAMPLFRRGAELAAKQGITLDESDMKECERMIGVRKILDGIDAGAPEPTGAAVLSDLGNVCYGLGRHARAARFEAAALAADPTIDPEDAAFNSALAGAGRGVDAPADEAIRARLRAEALAWLRGWLAIRAKGMESADLVARGKAWCPLSYLQRTPDLAGIRDEAELAKLPDEERAAFHDFWAQVAALIARWHP